MTEKRGILKPTKADDEPVATGGGSKNEIGWGDLAIYEFPNILGDNPAVGDGAPLTIGWEHESESVVAIEYYEFLRQSRPRRKRKDLVLSGGQRDTYLLGLGYRLDELIDVAEDMKKIRMSRRANMKGTWDKFRSLYEKAAGTFRNKKGSKTPTPKIIAAKSG